VLLTAASESLDPLSIRALYVLLTGAVSGGTGGLERVQPLVQQAGWWSAVFTGWWRVGVLAGGFWLGACVPDGGVLVCEVRAPL
jgi:hypothetical protein